MSHRRAAASAGRREVMRVATLVALGMAIAACSSGRDQNAALSAASGSTMQSTSGAVFDSMAGIHQPGGDATPAPRRRAFDLCQVLPPDSVTRILRSTIGKSVSVATSRPGGMCTYRDVASSTPGVRVLIDLGRDRSPAAAGVTLLGQRGQLGSQGVATTDIPGIADAAFGASDSTGRYTVMMQQDVVTGKVVVNVRGADGPSLRPAAVELAKRTLALLQQ